MFLGIRIHCASVETTVCGEVTHCPHSGFVPTLCRGQIVLRCALKLAVVMAPSAMVQFSNSLTVRDLSCFHNSFRIVFSSSLKAVIDILMGAAHLLFVIESHHEQRSSEYIY